MGIKGKWARLWVDEFDLSTQTSNAEVNMQISREDVTAWQATAAQFIAGDSESSINITGYVDTLTAGLGGLEEVIAARFATANDAQVGVMLAEAATGEVGMPVYVLPATSAESMAIAAPAAGILTLDGSFMGSHEDLQRGYLLYRGTVSATASYSPADFGVAGTTGGNAYLFVQAITGSATNAVVRVQSSATQAGTFVDEAAFVFSAIGGHAMPMTGAIDRWLRVNVTNLGGATAITIAVVACVNGVTQPA